MKKIAFFLILLYSVCSSAQNDQPLTRILFIFDASQSMLEQWDTDKKINIARKMLIRMLDSLEHINNIQLALRVYGHQYPVPPQRCDDTKLEVPFAADNAPKVRQKLRYIQPRGTTPIAHTLAKCSGDFPECANCRNIIILITDGIEECGGDPCEVSRELQQKGIILKPFVIGVGLDLEFKKTFECVGHFYNARNETEFRNVLNVVITQVLNTTSLQVNLLDQQGNPTETDVNMTFFDITSGRMIYN
ncbi:MAG: VWA domain-containing protein, partial [Bacteroidetes bacterium]|nr:VWA domain-containing protein [Bacteroidota bacterium]